MASGEGVEALMGKLDWASTSLGPKMEWSASLVAVAAITLGSRQPMFIAWGADRTLVYNDAYAVLLGERHPSAFGRPFFDVWPEVKEEVGSLMARVFEGESLHMDDLALMLVRNGRAEEAHFSFSYTPVRDRADAVAGLFCACVETTEYVMANRREAEETERQRQLLRQMPGFVGVLSGPDHVYDYVNDAYRRISGPRDFVGRTVRNVFPELAGQGFFALLDRVYASGEPFTAAALPIRLAGEEADRFIDLLYQPIRSAADSVTGILVAGYDVTERVRAEEALRQSEASFRTVAEAIPGFIWTADAGGRLDYTSPQWLAYSGSGSNESLGEGWAGYVHPDDRSEAFADWAGAVSAGTPYQREFRLRRADGAYRSWLARALPIADRPGDEPRWIGSCTDIDEIVQAREALSRSREELEARVEERTSERDRLWELSEDLLVLADFEGHLLRVSPSWTRLLGYTREALLSGRYQEIIHPDDLTAVMEALLHMRASGRPVSFEDRVLAADGSWKWLAWTLSPDPSGATLTGVGRNVTDEKARRAELEHAQEALRQSQKMEAVGQLTGGIAHDFNNLLTGVIGSLDMMQRRVRQGRSEDVERYATAAMTSANRAAALTHRLLAFSRRQPLDPKPTDANRLVTGMEELLRRTIGEAVRLEIVTAGGLWQTLCDPHQLESAVLNLAINARDAMPAGGTLTIETCNAHLDSAYAARSREVRPGQYVCVCVTDMGTGMPPDVIAKAFDPFFTTKPIGQGTGLGLSMIYGFARQSDGYAKIYSEVDKGTTVKLYLPRYYGEDQEEEPAALRPVEEHRAERGEVVVVVEDETAVRDLVIDVLRDLGYRTIEAVDGPSGLKILQSGLRVDLLVTDVGLPGLNGRQVADAARRTRPGLKVLFMTGYAENATLASGFLEPGMQMITKPFAVEALATRIRDMIEAGPAVSA